MNVSNWWGVLYGVTGCITLVVVVLVVSAFWWVRHAEPAEERTWTGDTGRPLPAHTDNVTALARDLGSEP